MPRPLLIRDFEHLGVRQASNVRTQGSGTSTESQGSPLPLLVLGAGAGAIALFAVADAGLTAAWVAAAAVPLGLIVFAIVKSLQ